MSGLVASYDLIAPEIVLVCGAMALLMLGVFRPENDREAETIGWLAIVVLGLAAWLVFEQPVGRQTLRLVPSSGAPKTVSVDVKESGGAARFDLEDL